MDSKSEKKLRNKKRKERIKRFKRNLRLSKRRTHFRVWKKDILSSITSQSKNITFFCHKKYNGIKNKSNIYKKKNRRYAECQIGASIEISKPFFAHIEYLFIKFYGTFPNCVTVRDNRGVKKVFSCSYLHQLFVLKDFKKSTRITIRFDEKVNINKLYILSEGNMLPCWVQQWKEPCKKSHLLAMSTHSDDEQLFFAGVLPLFVARKKKVQVSYFAPPQSLDRYNELLDGLWQIGIRNYPVFSSFKEAWSESYEEALCNLNKSGTSEDDVKLYIVSTIRRFKPDVVIGQDPIHGEYGHGQHMFFAKMLLDTIQFTNNPCFDVASINQYGIHQVPKLYLHLYPQNRIHINLDEPMQELDGLTPFQVSQEGFSRHRTQYVSFFPRFLFGTIRHPIKKASQIKKYSPCEWGLAYCGCETCTSVDVFEDETKQQLNDE